jgi:amino acid transporter
MDDDDPLPDEDTFYGNLEESVGDGEKDRTMTLFGVLMNTTSLVAPGCCMWMTFQVQVADPNKVADMMSGVLLAIIISFVTSLSYAALAKEYPEAGVGGAYYFAASVGAVFPKRKWARRFKLLVGWSAHQYYWMYPAVLIAYMTKTIQYLLQGKDTSAITHAADAFATLEQSEQLPVQFLSCFAICALVAAVALSGVEASAAATTVITGVQCVNIALFAAVALSYRYGAAAAGLDNGGGGGGGGGGGAPPSDISWLNKDVSAVVLPRSASGVIFQAGVAIFALSGYDSAATMGEQAIRPKRDIPLGLVSSVLVQGCGIYLLEYFAANMAINDKLILRQPSNVSDCACLSAAGVCADTTAHASPSQPVPFPPTRVQPFRFTVAGGSPGGLQAATSTSTSTSGFQTSGNASQNAPGQRRPTTAPPTPPPTPPAPLCNYTIGYLNYSGTRALAISPAPIALLTVSIGEDVLGKGWGYPFMLVQTVSVLLSGLGATLASFNTALRFSQAMAFDGELPQLFAVTHPRTRVPYRGLVFLSCFVFGAACAGVSYGVASLTMVMIEYEHR